jgi:hypothetical protein
MQKIKILAILSNLALITVCLIPLPKGLPSPFTRTDLVVHLGSYIIVTALFLLSYKNKLQLTILLILQGILIEVIQPYVNRYFEWYDIGANTLGVIISVLIFNFIKSKYPSE